MPIDSSMIPTYLQILQFGSLPAHSALTLIQTAADKSQAAQASVNDKNTAAPQATAAATPIERVKGSHIIDIRV